ncbi:MAG: hypothetical protein J6581_10095 [Apibacter sp.]|nr:hypothetical protein [Apibacter sp.]
MNNIKNEKFELQESSEIKNLIIIDSTFKEVNIQYGFTDYFKKIEEIEKPEKIAKLPNIIGEFTNVEKLSISPYTNIKNIENYQNLKEFYSFNLNKNLIKILFIILLFKFKVKLI